MNVRIDCSRPGQQPTKLFQKLHCFITWRVEPAVQASGATKSTSQSLYKNSSQLVYRSYLNSHGERVGQSIPVCSRSFFEHAAVEEPHASHPHDKSYGSGCSAYLTANTRDQHIYNLIL
jgi:hypothetical protein